jgi:type IV fimbrial biogenesis protein FimT
MVVLAVMGVLVTVVVPSFQSIYLNGLSAAQTNEFVASLKFSRSEAIKRGTSVTMCKSTDGATCDNSLSWQNGWIVRLASDTTAILRAHDQLNDPNTTLVGNFLVTNQVTFNADGSSQNGTFRLCDSRGETHAREIVISRGRTRIEKATKCDFS